MRVNILTKVSPSLSNAVAETPYVSPYNPLYQKPLPTVHPLPPLQEEPITVTTKYFETVHQTWTFGSETPIPQTPPMTMDIQTIDVESMEVVNQWLDTAFIQGNPSHPLFEKSEVFQQAITNGLNNPDPVLTMLADSGYTPTQSSNFLGFFDFFAEWRATGSFSQAMYGKPFSQVVWEFFTDLFHTCFQFFLSHADFFFLLPMMVVLILTYFVGKNKWSKWALPLGFGYFVMRILSIVLYQQP